MNGLEDGHHFSDVGSGNNAEAAHQPRSQVRDDVAVEIFQQKHIELLRIHDQLHAGVVHDLLILFDVGIVAGDAAETIEEKTVGQFHDIGLVNGRDFTSAFPTGVLEGKAGDAQRGPLGDDLEGFDHAGDDDVFQSGVQVLSVFSHHDQVHLAEARGHAGKRADGTEVGEQVQFLSQPDVDALKAFGNGRRQRPLQRHAIFFDGFEQSKRKRIAELVEGLHPGDVFIPFDSDPGGFDDLDDGCRAFRPDPIAGNECHAMSFPLRHGVLG